MELLQEGVEWMKIVAIELLLLAVILTCVGWEVRKVGQKLDRR